MQEIQNIVQNQIEAMHKDGTIEKTIREGVDKAIQAAIAENFEHYGSVTKQLKAAIQTQLAIDIESLDLPTYSLQMLAGVKHRLAEAFSNETQSKLMQELDTLLSPAPKEIDIHDLVTKLVKFWKDDASHYDAEEYGLEANVSLEKTDYNSYNLQLDSNADLYSTGKKICLHISLDGKIRISHRHEYNPTCLYREDAFIFQMYSAGTTITNLDAFDEHKCNLIIKEEY